MKKSAYILFFAVVALLAAGCQDEILPDGEVPGGESTLCFQPTLGSITVTKSNGGLTDSEPAFPVTVAGLVAADGSMSLPLACEVIDGIAGLDCNDGAPQTKGVQYNTGDDWDALGTYVDKFYVAAWKGGTSFVPAGTEVAKATPLWKTAATYRWEATEEATFYAYSNLPASGATVTPTSAGQILNYAVPAASSDQTDILMGYYSGKPKYDATLHKGGVAEVKFYHPLTAVRFKMGAFKGATSVQFKSISINGVYASGMATMTPATMGESDSGKKFTWNLFSAATRKVTMSPASGQTYLSLDANGFIGDAFLLIPQTMTSAKPVKISVTADVDGVEKKFDAKLADNTWQAGKTNVYTLGYSNRPAGALSGAFSVSKTKKVYFSKGLLQATVDASGNPTAWKFAPNQYYCIGEGGANKTIGIAAGDVDYFGWSTDGTGATGGYKAWGINTSTTNTDYYGNFVDWGIAYCNANGITPNTTWRTLSKDEWLFLLSYGSNGIDPNNTIRAELYARGVTVAGVSNCVIVYPDDYDRTKVVSDGDTTSYDTVEEWSAAEKEGAVCLLAARARSGQSSIYTSETVYIWSSTASGATQSSQMINVNNGQFPTSQCNRYFGRTVRLVTDAN